MKKLIDFLKSQPLLLTILTLLVFFTVILVISALSIKHTVEVEICVAPASATVVVDGKTYENGTYEITAGELSVHIEKSGFVSKDFTFNTTTNQKLYTYLLQEDGTYSWYESHESDALLLTKIGDYETGITASLYAENYSITSVLPIIYASYDAEYNYTEFRIDGGSFSGCDTNFCLKVTDVTGGNLDLAKSKITAAGYNPDDYQILYEYTPITPLE